MSACISLIGRRYERLVVLERVGKNHRGRSTWLCRCDCGGEKIANSEMLRKGNTKSCGCLQSELWQKNLQRGSKPGRMGRGRKKKPPKTGQARWDLTGYTQDEMDAIRKAVAAGRITRIENGEWPDDGRLYQKKRWAFRITEA
jgi:hypothetical protein